MEAQTSEKAEPAKFKKTFETNLVLGTYTNGTPIQKSIFKKKMNVGCECKYLNTVYPILPVYRPSISAYAEFRRATP